jgi:hypothetical protein
LPCNEHNEITGLARHGGKRGSNEFIPEFLSTEHPINIRLSLGPSSIPSPLGHTHPGHVDERRHYALSISISPVTRPTWPPSWEQGDRGEHASISMPKYRP